MDSHSQGVLTALCEREVGRGRGNYEESYRVSMRKLANGESGRMRPRDKQKETVGERQSG